MPPIRLADSKRSSISQRTGTKRIGRGADIDRRGEWRLEHERADGRLRSELDRDAGAERFAVKHDALGRDALPPYEVERGAAVGIEPRFGRTPGIAAIAAILGEQDAEAGIEIRPHQRRAVADMAGIAVEMHDDRRRRIGGRPVPRGQGGPVDGAVGDH